MSAVEIGVWVDGSQKWVSGVTRRTTCHDLIRALLRAQDLSATDGDVIGHTIVERWKKVERPLDHEQRILKVWKSWGEAVHQVRFSLRRGRSGELPDGEEDNNPCKKRDKPCDDDRDNNHNTTNKNSNKENNTQHTTQHNDCGGGGTSLDEAESSCGRSERSRRRHKMRQSRREAVACQQRMQQKVHPLYHHHRPVDTSPHPASDDSDGKDGHLRRSGSNKPDQRRPPRDDPRYSETMERLMRLVVAQGETIQQQLRRLNQRQTQIESYEQQMHLLRVQSLGNDYLLSSYLHDQQHQPQEVPGHGPALNQDHNCRVAGLGGLPLSRDEPLHPASVGDRPSYGGTHQPIMPGLPMIREVHAKPINLHDDPGDLVIHGGPDRTHDAFGVLQNNFGGGPGRFSGRFNRFTNSKDETISEEKSNDSGVVITDDILGSSVEERTQSEIEDFSEEEVQERIVLLSKMEDVFTRLIHEEEVIHGLNSTIEVMQTQQKLETTELEADLKRAAEEHSLLVAEARSNEQQIRVMDTSASQKKKLIEALLKDEVDSDQETRYLQAQLDYILHLPPTAFRLPEEGDDPPPLPPPPVHPACLVQSLLHHQPPQLVPPSHSRPSPPSRPLPFSPNNSAPPLSAFVNRPPSPNILYVNRAPSPTVLLGGHRAASPNTRLVHRSCSPNKRKPLQPPSYDRLPHILSSNTTEVNNTRLNEVLITNDTKSSLTNTPSNLSSTNANSILKSLMSNSLPSLPNRTNPASKLSKKGKDGRDNQTVNTVSNNNLVLLNQRTDNCNVNNVNSNPIADESSEDVPPPLPSCPPPSLTPPLNNAINNNTTGKINNENLNNNNRTNANSNNTCITANENSNNKRNILNSFVSVGKKSLVTADQTRLDNSEVKNEDEDSSSRASSPCVSARSSTASEASLTNSSSSASSTAVSRHQYGASFATKMAVNAKRNNNAISCVRSATTNTIIGGTDKGINDTVVSGKKDADTGDSNSDTGLSSLHSSSDEAGYPLDTLV